MSDDPAPPPAGDPENGAWGSRRALEVLGLAFLFPAAVVVGYFAGRWIGSHAGAPAAGSIVGALAGAAAGFWQLFAYLKRRA